MPANDVDRADKKLMRAQASAASGSNDIIELSLYARSQKIYPRQVHGIFAFLRVCHIAVARYLLSPPLAGVEWQTGRPV